MSQFEPQPIGGAPATADVFDYDGQARVDYMKRLGARNTDPPLPRSSHLKIKANGRVLPWDATLAIQTDLVECCDSEGNTDPEAWEKTVDHSAYDPEEGKALQQQAQAIAIAQATKMSTEHTVENHIDMTPRPMKYPDGIVPYEEVDSVSSSEVTELMNSLR